MLGVRSVYVDVANEIVLVQSTLPSSTVQRHLEQTGKLVVFRGYGSGGEGAGVAAPSHHGAAVSIMKWKGVVHGLARLVQVSLVLYHVLLQSSRIKDANITLTCACMLGD